MLLTLLTSKHYLHILQYAIYSTYIKTVTINTVHDTYCYCWECTKHTKLYIADFAFPAAHAATAESVLNKADFAFPAAHAAHAESVLNIQNYT